MCGDFNSIDLYFHLKKNDIISLGLYKALEQENNTLESQKKLSLLA